MENVPTVPAESPQTVQRVQRPQRRRGRSFIGPLILILLGILFLAQNLGLLSGDVWWAIWRLWPLVLVLIGIELIFGRTGWGAAIATIVLLVSVVGFVAAAGYVGQLGGWSIGGWTPAERPGVSFGSMESERFVEELGDSRRATIDLRHGAGRLTVGALPADSDNLLDADLASSAGIGMERRVDREGDRVTVQLREKVERNPIRIGDPFRHDWSLHLSPKLPMELLVHTGASELNLDLSRLLVTRLEVDAGASSLKILMPEDAGRTEARVKAGAAGVEIRIPEGVAARVTTRGGLSGTNVDESRFPKVGNRYQSRNYDTATNRLELVVETGISGVTIR